jgi:hypothetical protein
MLLAALSAPAAAAAGELAREIPGLVAWYTAETLHDIVADGEPVPVWPDASGHGHDLVGQQEGQPAIFRLKQLNERAVVTIGRLNSYTVTAPFELGDHTIFLVLSATLTNRALFCSDLDRTLGVLLRRDDTHRFQNGGVARGQLVSYTGRIPPGPAFGVTVLGRQEGELHAFVDGEDLSSRKYLPTPVRVGRFFAIEHTRQASTDGAGLVIAEMLFYDRFLAAEERQKLTRHLGEKYGILAREAPQASPPPPVLLDPAKIALRATLTSAGPFNVGPRSAPLAIPWEPRGTVSPPLARDPDHPTRIVAAADGTAVQLLVRLEVVAPGRAPPSVRVAMLRNNREYVHDAAAVESFQRWGEGFKGAARLETVVALEAGDYVEIVPYLGDGPAAPADGGGEALRAVIEAGAAVLEARTP